MGSWFSFGPVAPPAIKLGELLQQKTDAVEQFRDNYRRLGFAVVEVNDEFVNLCAKYRNTCDEWFKSHNFNEKQKFENKPKDELFAELGRKPNEGYVLTAHKKEYLKFKAGSDRELFPTDEIYDQCQVLIKQWRVMAEACLDTILLEKALDEKTKEEDSIVTEEELENIKKFGEIHASVSQIHYFKERTIEEEKMTEDEKISNRTIEMPLGEHVDTGVITLIMCSDISGLEMLDRRSNQYFKCENMYEAGKHMFIIAGRKLELFSSKKQIMSTWHRVKIDIKTERYSLLYFWEIQKDH